MKLRFRHFRYLVPALVVIWAGTGCATGRTQTTLVSRVWQEEQFGGRVITTPNFDIYTTVDDAEFTAALPHVLEAAHREFSQVFPGDAQGRRLSTYLFQTRGEWGRFCQARWPDRMETLRRIHVGGYTFGDTSASFYVNRSTALATVVHEAWHQYVEARAEGMPSWLHEGMACYFEAVQWRDGLPWFGTAQNTFRLGGLREALTLNHWQPMSELLGSHAGRLLASGDNAGTQHYYAQVWALMVFLRDGGGAEYRNRLNRLLSDIATHQVQGTVSAWRVASEADRDITYDEAVFRAYFGADPDALDPVLRRHAQRLCGM